MKEPYFGDGMKIEPHATGPKILHYSGLLVTTTHIPPGKRPYLKGTSFYSRPVSPALAWPHDFGRQRGQFKLRK